MSLQLNYMKDMDFNLWVQTEVMEKLYYVWNYIRLMDKYIRMLCVPSYPNIIIERSVYLIDLTDVTPATGKLTVKVKIRVKD